MDEPSPPNSIICFQLISCPRGFSAGWSVPNPPEQVDGAIEDAQRRIVEALDLDRAALYEFVDANGSLLFTHFWSRPDSRSLRAGR